jgi:hypothetical protein
VGPVGAAPGAEGPAIQTMPQFVLSWGCFPALWNVKVSTWLVPITLYWGQTRWPLPGGIEDSQQGGSQGATCEPFGPLPLRSLQPALRARSFCKDHAQLFRWICIGLLCTGEPGTYSTQDSLPSPHFRTEPSLTQAQGQLQARNKPDQLPPQQQGGPLITHTMQQARGAPRGWGGGIREDFQGKVPLGFMGGAGQ